MLNGRVLFSTSALCNPNANLDHGAKSSIATAKSEEKQVTGKFSVPLLLTFGLKITLIRVITALGFLVGAKVLNVQVSFLSKLAVDWFTTATGNATALASFSTANSILIALVMALLAMGLLLSMFIYRTENCPCFLR
ncbi:hypothetical protein P3X46_022073 [Hevea brasiliensis]|uniref:CASP-like protein n=1 Tax=Hevea brasiliensis TaxID=3981 RepID=A0ABQ9LHH9_HEVBR|nr:hypothetical protein P3X46_022073 [Hevea brasiliensis]